MKENVDYDMTKKVLSFYLNTYLKYKKYFYVYILASVFSILVSLLPPIFYKKIVDLITSSSFDKTLIMNQAMWILAIVAILKFISFILDRFIIDKSYIDLELKADKYNYMKSFDNMQ